MIAYEILLMLDPELAEERQNEIVARARELIEKAGGTWSNHDVWGRRKLAYEINDLSEGYYAICTYNVDASARAEIEAALPFVEGLVRTKTVRRDVRTRGV